MKKALLFLFALLIPGLIHAQLNPQLKFHYALADEIMVSPGLDGGPGYGANKLLNLGLRYFIPTGNHSGWSTGVDLLDFEVEISPNLPPGEEEILSYEEITMISVPVTYNVFIVKNYIFFGVGANIDIEVDHRQGESTENQNGLGFNLNLGGNYYFGHLMLTVNPYLQMHSLLNTKQNQPKLLHAGVKLGIGYQF